MIMNPYPVLDIECLGAEKTAVKKKGQTVRLLS